MKAKRIVCFGGGSVVPTVLLEPLKKYPLNIASVTSMTDDGGSTGQLRREFGVLPPGDIRRHVLAFSDAPEWKKKLWSWRFGGEEFAGGHKGHSFGNVFLAGVERSTKDFELALAEAVRFMEVDKRYRPLPATLAKVALCARLEGGSTIEGESEIDVPKRHDPKTPIEKIFLRPGARANKEVVAEIVRADALILGPGDLFSSTLPCLLPVGIKAAIAKSKAKKLLVCNIMNKRGETEGFTVADYARVAEQYLGCELTYVLYNRAAVSREAAAAARRQERSLLGEPEFDGTLDRDKFIGMNLLRRAVPAHDPKKTAAAVWKLINEKA